MAQTRTNLAWETLFDVSAQPPGPLHDRLTRAIRSAIRDGPAAARRRLATIADAGHRPGYLPVGGHPGLRAVGHRGLPVWPDRHLRASRLRFRNRRNGLLAALERHLPGYPVSGTESGLHVLLELPPGTDLSRLTAEAARHGLALCDPTDMWGGFQPLPLLPVGYANLNDAVIDEAVATPAKLITTSTERVGSQF